MKYTPGPWSYDADENEIHSDSMQDSGGDPAHICEMLNPNILKNAKLICTAPEMFELLLKIHVIGKYVLSQDIVEEIQRIIDKVEK